MTTAIRVVLNEFQIELLKQTVKDLKNLAKVENVCWAIIAPNQSIAASLEQFRGSFDLLQPYSENNDAKSLLDNYDKVIQEAIVFDQANRNKNAPTELSVGMMGEVRNLAYSLQNIVAKIEKGELTVEKPSEARPSNSVAEKQIFIDLKGFNRNTGSFNLLKDLIYDAQRNGITLDKDRHGKKQPQSLRDVLRNNGYENVAKKVKYRKNKVELDIPFERITTKRKK